MSALILKKKFVADRGEYHYRIIRQLEKLRDHGLIMECSNDVHVGSYSYPAFDMETRDDGRTIGRHLKLRGDRGSKDCNWFSVEPAWVDRMEQAVVEVNKKFGNNQDISVEDVIWNEDET
jgi:hypothetical protein